MVKKIIWTPEAQETYQNIISYLLENWSEKEIEKFVSITEKIIESIAHQPLMFRRSEKYNFHEAVITKHNILIYVVKTDCIDLISFWDTRQNPVRKIKLLK